MSREVEHLKAGVEAQHECDAKWINSMPVAAKASGKLVWDGTVHIFELAGHPQYERCYAWFDNEFGPLDERKVTSQPKADGINSAADAVTAAMEQQ